MWLGPGLVLWAPAALGALSPLPDALSTDDLCFGLAPLQFPLADFPWFWHLWMFLDSPLWLKFHLPNFMQWPWRALFQGASHSPPPPQCLHSATSETLVSPISVPLLFLHLSCLQKQCCVDDAPSSVGSRCSLSLLDPSCSGLCVFESALGETHPLAANLQQGTLVVAMSV